MIQQGGMAGRATRLLPLAWNRVASSRLRVFSQGFRDEFGYIADVKEGAIVTFTGNVLAKEVTNVGSVFKNAGSME